MGSGWGPVKSLGRLRLVGSGVCWSLPYLHSVCRKRHELQDTLIFSVSGSHWKAWLHCPSPSTLSPYWEFPGIFTYISLVLCSNSACIDLSEGIRGLMNLFPEPHPWFFIETASCIFFRIAPMCEALIHKVPAISHCPRGCYRPLGT